MTLGCRAFFCEFLAEFEKENRNTKWEKIYDKNRIWTAKMLARAHTLCHSDLSFEREPSAFPIRMRTKDWLSTKWGASLGSVNI